MSRDRHSSPQSISISKNKYCTHNFRSKYNLFIDLLAKHTNIVTVAITIVHIALVIFLLTLFFLCFIHYLIGYTMLNNQVITENSKQ